MSFAPEVIADSSGKWCGNALRFATQSEAESYVLDLASRWTSVSDTRVIEVDEPVTYKIVGGKLLRAEVHVCDEPGCSVCDPVY